MPQSNKLELTHSNSNYFVRKNEPRYYILCSKTENTLKNSNSKAINKLIYNFGIKKIENVHETIHSSYVQRKVRVPKYMLPITDIFTNFVYWDLRDFQLLLNQYDITANDFTKIKKHFKYNLRKLNMFADKHKLCLDLRNVIMQFLM